MRILSLIIVGCSLVIAGTVFYREARPGSSTDAAIQAVEIRVTGLGNTLAGLAALPSSHGLISYDLQTRTATSHATIAVEGELVLGSADDRSAGETLQFDTQACGDMRLEVRSSGALRLYHSTIQTVSQVLTPGACSRGYAFFVDGELVMKDSRVSYISGSTSECLRGQAKATILHSVFSYCDGSALSCIGVDGTRIQIEDCDFRGSGNWGVVIEGSGGAPIEFRRSLLDAKVGGLLVTGRSAGVRLIDCVFDPTRLVFNHDSGAVQVAWTRRVQVLDPGTREPVAGALVRAEADDAAVVEARTDAQGLAELLLVERDVLPGARRNVSPPRQYRLVVKPPAGKPWIGCSGYSVRGKDNGTMVLNGGRADVSK